MSAFLMSVVVGRCMNPCSPSLNVNNYIELSSSMKVVCSHEQLRIKNFHYQKFTKQRSRCEF